MKRIVRDVGADVEREIRNHIDERAAVLVEQGWAPEDARREAERRFGDVNRIRSELMTLHEGRQRRLTATDFLSSILSDVRYAFRGIVTNPTFSTATVSTLALGIGAAGSIFAVADALLFRPLPYVEHDRWVQVHEEASDGSYAGPLPIDRFAAVREAGGQLAEEWIVFQWAGLSRTDGSQVETLDVLAVSPGADRQLGIPLALGRSFTPDDALPGASATAIVTQRYWRRLGMDPGIVGRTIRLEDQPVTVVGVLASDAKFPPEGRDIDIWLPIRTDFGYLDRRLGSFMGVWALLPDGVELAAARARFGTIEAGIREAAADRQVGAALRRGNHGRGGALPRQGLQEAVPPLPVERSHAAKAARCRWRVLLWSRQREH